MLAAVLASIGTGLAGAASPAVAAGGTWRTEAPMNHARAAHAVVSDGSAIYALAGTGTGGAPVLVVERFDGKRWRSAGTLPGQGLNAPAAVALNGKVYVLGGFGTDTNVPVDTVLVFDTKSGLWSRAAPLPAPRGGHAAVVLAGRIHVLGGGNSQSTIADHDVYDPATDRWASLARLPRSKGSPAAAAFGGKIFAIGGRSGPDDFGTVDVYNPATDTWSQGPPIEPRGTAGAVVYCGAIHVFGGESQARRQSLGDVLRLAGGTRWEKVASLPTPRNFARAVVFGDAVYVAGGSPTPEASHSSVGSAIVERFHQSCRRG
jgi:N-acetylneuraminic acid mutarotase